MPRRSKAPARADVTLRLREAITRGRLMPNERLIEADLASTYGVNRVHIRTALAMLDQEGLVVREKNRGARVRALPKPLWLLLVVLVPFLGPLAWLLAGRPVAEGRGRASSGARRTGTRAPDDDPEFLAALARSNRQRERERRQRERKDRPPDEPGPSA